VTKRLSMLKAKFVVLLTGAILATPLLIASASTASAHDSYPCGPQYYQPWAAQWHVYQGLDTSRVQICPLWKGNVPVYSAPSRYPQQVGTLNWAAGNWFYCQFQVGTTPGNFRTYRYGPYWTTWWAVTVSDYPYAFGVVPEVFFKGGDNNEPDATLRRCQ
jgi:hypothetical protein